MSESEIFAQAAKRKQAAVEELTRLQLRVQCVSDAYLCSSLHDRCCQVRARPCVCACTHSRLRRSDSLCASVLSASCARQIRAALGGVENEIAVLKQLQKKVKQQKKTKKVKTQLLIKNPKKRNLLKKNLLKKNN